MSRTVLARGLLSALCVAGAIVLSVWGGIPWGGISALALLGGCSLGLVLTRETRVGPLEPRVLALAWACTLLVPGSLLLARNKIYTLDTYYGLVAWLMAGALWAGAVGNRLLQRPKRWEALAMTWAAVGVLLWLGASYSLNQRIAFYFGLVFALAWLVISKLRFRLPFLGIQLVNTLLLLVIALPVADLLVRPAYHLDTQPGTGRRYYSYAAAKHDPAAFAQWWNYYLDQWNLMGNVFMKDPDHVLPHRLRPGAQGSLFQSRISINSLGFRGPEISTNKGKAYRIFALGESTTYGCTLAPSDKPWPEVLEQMIQQRLKPSRPVEVINAGVPAYNLEHNLYRLPQDILPLKPDMIISYHGVNGFRMLDHALPPVSGRIPPVYRKRPLKLLADAEHRLKILYYRQRQGWKLVVQSPTPTNALQSEYARAYRDLIHIAQTNGVRLALANFCLAVNRQSDLDVVRFYQATFPQVFSLIRANLAHSLLVEQLAQQHPGVCFVDTHPRLDGVHENFIDAVHLTQEGRQQLAENVFAGIRKVLEEDLSRRDDATAAP
jgi:lysophospholipase L1-like esterase